MADCLFCSIAAKEIPAETVYEDGNVMAFLDIHPRSPGHTIVIPKKHAGSLLELPGDGISPLFAAVQSVTARIKKALLPDAFTIGINEGKEAGQAIAHLHVHILPRFEDDAGGSIHTVVNNPPSESIGELAKKIRETH
jgi:histidine triad (HIT) family protein